MQDIRIRHNNENTAAQLHAYKNIIKDCLEELEEAGVQTGYVSEFIINRTSIDRWGCCHAYKDHYAIEIALCLLETDVPPKITKEVLLHEFCHAFPGAYTHTGIWKQRAGILNKKYGYHISNGSAKADATLPITVIMGHPKYLLHCDRCGARYDRMRKSVLVQHPERYRCAYCGGDIVPDGHIEASYTQSLKGNKAAS